MKKKIKVIALRMTFPHIGTHSGYDQLFKDLENKNNVALFSLWRINRGFFNRMVDLASLPFFRMYYGNHFFSLVDWMYNKRAARLAKNKKADIIHLTHLENSYSDPFKLFKNNENVKVIGTIHQPLSWWKIKVRRLTALHELDALIVMSDTEKNFFESYLPHKVHFIGHGIDTGFFYPDATIEKDYKSCVFAGNWMRNIPLLIKIIDQIAGVDPGIKFNVINPHFENKSHPIYALRERANVALYKDLSDEELRDVYRRSAVLLLPLFNSTVNNALLEGAACGLPVIASDVGGVRDYTSSSFCEYIATNDPLYEVELFSRQIIDLLGSRELIEEKGREAAKYIQQNFSWRIIAEKTASLYGAILS